MKFISLVSSGIDSPVATYVIAKQNQQVILVHANNTPFSGSHEQEKFLSLARHLHQQCPQITTAILVPHGPALHQFRQKANNKFTCVFCKRMLVRYAEAFAHQHDCSGIIMGDSLGQVASQTLYNLQVVESAITLPILRPLIGMDKLDVIEIAKDIGTYELSIQSSEGCLAVPSKPSTHAKIEQLNDEEQKIDVEALVREAIENAEVISL